MDNGLVQKNDLVKILGRGELTAKLDITVNAFSATQKQKLQQLSYNYEKAVIALVGTSFSN